MKQYLLLLIVLLGIVTGGYFIWHNRETTKFGTIIFLNGSSSSGKTSIAKELQKLFDVPVLHMGIDNFLFMMPQEERWFKRIQEPEQTFNGPAFAFVKRIEDDKPVVAVEFGPWGEKLVSGMYEAMGAMVRQEFTIIVDDVIFSKENLNRAVRSFKQFKTYFIGVKCPLEVLEKREKERSDRAINMARHQYKVVHTFSPYDFEVDTSVLTPQECAQKIKSFMDTHEPEIFRSLL